MKRARYNIRSLDELGRILLPLEFRRRLNMEEGDEIQISLDEEEGTITVKLVKKA